MTINSQIVFVNYKKSYTLGFYVKLTGRTTTSEYMIKSVSVNNRHFTN